MPSPIIEKLKNDTHFRIKSFLLLSLFFNVAYSMFLFVISRVYSSMWFLVMSVYYGLLSVARIFVFAHTDQTKQLRSKKITMRVCGYFLFLINLVVAIMMFILIFDNHNIKHHEIVVITLATYSFTSLTVAIISSIKYLRQNDYVYSCVKIISLISASVSLVTLTNTMLITFGEENSSLRSIILPILSGGVSIFIIACAVFMIHTANSDLRTSENGKE